MSLLNAGAQARKSALDLVMRQIARGLDEPAIRLIDRRILAAFSAVGCGLGLDGARRLREAPVLDLAYILAASFAKTKRFETLRFEWPITTSVALTARCTAGCTVCYSDSKANGPSSHPMPLDLIRKLATTPIPVFLLTGGEPVSHPKIVDICRAFLENERKIILATSAYHHGLKQVFSEFQDRTTVLLSIWGQKPTHDAIRGTGSLSSTHRRIRQYLDAGARCSLNLVISDPTASCLDEAISAVEQNPSIHQIYVTRMISTGRFLPETMGANLDSDNLSERCHELETATRKRVIVNIPELAIKRPSMIGGMALRILGIAMPEHCASRSWTMHISHDGTCHGCFGLDRSASAINIRDSSIKEAWDKLQQTKRSEHFAHHSCASELVQRRFSPTNELRIVQ